MHTEGKWGFARAERAYNKGDISINTVDKEGSVTSDLICLVRRVPGDDFANAKRIVQAVNSYDGLLEVCVLAREYIFEGGNSRILGEKLNKAIAQAEE